MFTFSIQHMFVLVCSAIDIIHMHSAFVYMPRGHLIPFVHDTHPTKMLRLYNVCLWDAYDDSVKIFGSSAVATTTRDDAFGANHFFFATTKKQIWKFTIKECHCWGYGGAAGESTNSHMWAGRRIFANARYIKFHCFSNEKWKCTTIRRNCDTWRKWMEPDTIRFLFARSFSLWVMGILREIYVCGGKRTCVRLEKNDTKLNEIKKEWRHYWVGMVTGEPSGLRWRQDAGGLSADNKRMFATVRGKATTSRDMTSMKGIFEFNFAAFRTQSRSRHRVQSTNDA